MSGEPVIQASTKSSTMSTSTAPRKKPQWLLDEEASDPTLAAKLDAARVEAARLAAEKAAVEKARHEKCVAWHIARPEWVMQMVEISPGVRGSEREWEVPPKTGLRRVRNNEKCPYCGK